MGLINIYDSISNEHKEINGNGYLKNLLPGYNLNNCEIIKAGVNVGADYEVKSDDVLYLRVTPRAVTTALLVTATITGVVALAGAVVGGILLLKANKKTKEEMEKAQRDANSLAQQIDTKPYLKGAKNKSALGSLMPYQFGEMYNTPLMLSDGFIKITGDRGPNEYYNFNLNLGYGDLVVKKVLIGDEVILENADGIADGIHSFNESSPYYDADNFIELRQAGNNFTSADFNKKIVLTNCGDELKHDHDDAAGTEVIKQVADHTQKLEVCIQFNGLRIYDSNRSTWKARKAIIRPYWSNDGGSTWNEFYFTGMTDNTIEINTKNTIRFVATKEFTPSEVMTTNAAGEIEYKNILLKVVKTTPKAENNSNEDCYLLYHQSYCYDPKKSNLTSLVSCAAIEPYFINKLTRLALHIKATESTDGQLDDVHIIASSKGPIWNGTNWSTTKAATSNPAAIIYEILTSDKHKPSKLTADEFDRDDLGALYEYCEEMGYKSNAIITSAIKKKDIIDNILKTINAVMYKQNGVLHFAIDKLEPLPVALINAENIKTIRYTKELKRKPNGVKVTYTNSKTWSIDTFYLVIDPVTNALRDYKTDDDIITELALDYVTEYKHAARLALRNLKELNLQPRQITAGVGKYGDRYQLFNVVLLQYKEFRQGLRSTTIESLITNSNGDIVGISVSDVIDLYIANDIFYGIIIEAVNENGQKLYYKAVQFDTDLVALGTSKGKLRTSRGLLGVKKPDYIKTRKFYFNEPIAADSTIKPALFNAVSIGLLDDDGEFETITNKMKITAIDADGSNGFNLTLKDYNPSIYDNTQTIPAYKSNITPPTKTGKTIPSNPNISVTPAAAAEAIAEIYQETGLDKLDSVEITETNEETGETTIKADLIKGAAGVFDNIKSENGTFNNCTVTGKLNAVNGLFFKYNVHGIDSEENLYTILQNNFYSNIELTYGCIGVIKHGGSNFEMSIDIFTIKRTSSNFEFGAVAQVIYKNNNTTEYLEGTLTLSEQGLYLDGSYLGSNQIYYNFNY